MMSGTPVRTLKEASITASGLNPECLIEIRWKVPSETNVELIGVLPHLRPSVAVQLHIFEAQPEQTLLGL
jgi:hypothetical protein